MTATVDVPALPALCPACAELLAAGRLPLAVADLPGGEQALAAYCPESRTGALLIGPLWHVVGPIDEGAWSIMAKATVVAVRSSVPERARCDA